MATTTHTITVADLTLRADDRVATYKLGDKTYTVFAFSHGFTVPELVQSVKDTQHEDSMNPWIRKAAYEAGIRVDF